MSTAIATGKVVIRVILNLTEDGEKIAPPHSLDLEITDRGMTDMVIRAAGVKDAYAREGDVYQLHWNLDLHKEIEE